MSATGGRIHTQSTVHIRERCDSTESKVLPGGLWSVSGLAWKQQLRSDSVTAGVRAVPGLKIETWHTLLVVGSQGRIAN